jgi:hypothetical protein
MSKLDKLLDTIQFWSVKALVYFGVALWGVIILIACFSFI